MHIYSTFVERKSVAAPHQMTHERDKRKSPARRGPVKVSGRVVTDT